MHHTGSTARFTLEKTSSHAYSNAQIDDYQGLARRRLLWKPPLRLEVRARFSHPASTLQGTAGFGFWNDPFLLTGRKLPALPRHLWFFYASPPSDMKLDLHTPGFGWKAAVLDALRPQALAWAPLAPVLVAAMQSTTLYHHLWPPIQRSLRARERLVQADMTDWRTYHLEWANGQARFAVSENSAKPRLILDGQAPPGPLGFVMWIDNQYLVATPQGRFRWGTVGLPQRQWMEVDRLQIEPL
jgi:hypothetical protein